MPTIELTINPYGRLCLESEESCCLNCRSFRQHFVMNQCCTCHGARYTPTLYGHCTPARKNKSRKAYDHCERFEMRKP